MSQFFVSGGQSIGVISVPYFKTNYSWDSLRNFLKFTVSGRAGIWFQVAVSKIYALN